MQLEKLHQVAVFSRDLGETKTFYEETLGAKLLAYFEGPPGLLFFDFLGTRILFEKAAHTATLYFWVDDLNASYEELKAKGVAFVGKPHPIFRDEQGTFGTAGYVESMVFFKDPSGNTLALATQQPPE
ncbi:MAG: VOC family protein [Gemmatimonadetes bacterium]|nr:VOC family protein [Gemmatimonadota bacterium]